MAQKNLGLVYSTRIIGNKAENLDKAIKAYEAAFQVFTHDTFPDYWAKNQNNLAIAYTHLGKIDQAIACCRFALKVFTVKAFPSQCFTSGRQLGEIAAKAKLWLEAVEYRDWEREYKMYARFNRLIREIESASEEFPFSHPRYWSGFICQGLR
jgi:tetratricopeptide (TPR) repeat protein